MDDHAGRERSPDDSTPVLPGFAGLIPRYDTFVLDQWGVLHEGNRLFDGVVPLLAELRGQHKDVVILTNSSKSAARNVRRLEERFGLARGYYKELVSSADLVHDWVTGAYRVPGLTPPRAVFVCAEEGDEQILDGIPVEVVDDIGRADAVVVLSLPVTATADDHREWMAAAVDAGLPLVCPASDVHTVRPDGVYAGTAGVIGGYAALGGRCFNLGKPSPHVFTRCGQHVDTADPARVLMVGDQIASDVVGARTQGWHTALVTTGAGTLAMATAGVRPDYVVDELRL